MCSLITGIVCAMITAAWGEPPKLCSGHDRACDIKSLHATSALQAVSPASVTLRYI